MRIIYQFLSINFLKVLNKILGLSFFPVYAADGCMGSCSKCGRSSAGICSAGAVVSHTAQGNSSFTNPLNCKLEMGARAVHSSATELPKRGTAVA